MKLLDDPFELKLLNCSLSLEQPVGVDMEGMKTDAGKGKDEDGERIGKDEDGERIGKDEDGERIGKDEDGERIGKDEDAKDDDGDGGANGTQACFFLSSVMLP